MNSNRSQIWVDQWNDQFPIGSECHVDGDLKITVTTSKAELENGIPFIAVSGHGKLNLNRVLMIEDGHVQEGIQK
jgi:hypothetical protein